MTARLIKQIAPLPSTDAESPAINKLISTDPEANARTAAVNLLTNDFEDNLQKLDDKTGWNLTGVWKQCIRFHDDNQMLRANMMQMQVVNQDHARLWVEIKTMLSDHLTTLDKSDPTYLESVEKVMKMSAQAADMLSKSNQSVTSLKKEIRMTEFQSKFFFHVNIVQQFMAGMTAILFKHLQSTDQLKAVINDMRKLGKVFSMTAEARQEERDGE